MVIMGVTTRIEFSSSNVDPCGEALVTCLGLLPLPLGERAPWARDRGIDGNGNLWRACDR